MTQEDIILKFRIDELEECLDLIEDEISDKINHGHYKQEESYMNLVLNCTGKVFCSPYQSWCFNRRRFYYSNSCPSSGNYIAFYPPGSGNFYRRNRAGSPGSRLSPLSPLPSVLRPTDSPPYMPDH